MTLGVGLNRDARRYPNVGPVGLEQPCGRAASTDRTPRAMDSAFTSALAASSGSCPGNRASQARSRLTPSAGAHEDELTEAFGRRAGQGPALRPPTEMANTPAGRLVGAAPGGARALRRSLEQLSHPPRPSPIAERNRAAPPPSTMRGHFGNGPGTIALAGAPAQVPLAVRLAT